MGYSDFHIHTRFSDGADRPETMIRAAIRRGMPAVGFSDHAHTAFDESGCMSLPGTEEYRRRIARLRERYAGRIEVYCGVEQDYYSDTPIDGFDYVIGSVHYVEKDGAFLPVDETPEHLLRAAREHFGGDLMSLCEAYYELVGNVADKTAADLIGHFDLIAKFNEGDRLFDSTAPRYRAAWQAAADRLLKTGLPFEINFGAISRGYRTEPYPSREIRDYLAARGARFVLSSDSHRKETLCFGFNSFDLAGVEFAPFPPGKKR